MSNRLDPTRADTPQEPPSRPEGRVWLISASAGLALILLVAVVAAYLIRGGTGSPVSALPTSPVASPMPSATPSAEPTILSELGRKVKAKFPDPAVGRRMELKVLPVKKPDRNCLTYAFRLGGLFQSYVGAYYSGCKDWQAVGLDIVQLSVQLRDVGDTKIAWTRGRFYLIDTDGKRHDPIGVLSNAKNPSQFLGRNGKINGHDLTEGLLVFDSKPNFVPRRLVYVDGDQHLIIEFAGDPRRFGRA